MCYDFYIYVYVIVGTKVKMFCRGGCLPARVSDCMSWSMKEKKSVDVRERSNRECFIWVVDMKGLEEIGSFFTSCGFEYAMGFWRERELRAFLLSIPPKLLCYIFCIIFVFVLVLLSSLSLYSCFLSLILFHIYTLIHYIFRFIYY